MAAKANKAQLLNRGVLVCVCVQILFWRCRVAATEVDEEKAVHLLTSTLPKRLNQKYEYSEIFYNYIATAMMQQLIICYLVPITWNDFWVAWHSIELKNISWCVCVHAGF